MAKLGKEVHFSFREPDDENNTLVRFATSRSTEKESIDSLDTILSTIKA